MNTNLSEKAMAPTKVKNSGNKDRQVKKSSKSSAPKAVSTKASKVHRAKAPPPKQQKTKPVSAPVKKKQRLYSEKELDLPRLNMITPVGVNLPQGKKKGKVFIDDQVRQYNPRLQAHILINTGLLGKHDDYFSNCQRGQRRPDRE